MSSMNLKVFSKISGLYSPERSSKRGSRTTWRTRTGEGGTQQTRQLMLGLTAFLTGTT